MREVDNCCASTEIDTSVVLLRLKWDNEQMKQQKGEKDLKWEYEPWNREQQDSDGEASC